MISLSSGSTIDATQELFTLSMCNFIGSFFSSMPITGSFSRSAVNHASGVQTPFGGVITEHANDSGESDTLLSFAQEYFPGTNGTHRKSVELKEVAFGDTSTTLNHRK
ncbi:hypothetical protein NQ314_002735 [Rhamnusium bicolor]|uniref:SLC26A/SulP transporter domain-containing protein n=1 Tax=Rhamnusium bicolor TaxID=1586634 RepID=A0AAV8ZPP0_9CUCU|nr:hypothetical protein NQ314_002735 [Rhamnusium bicolor]